MIASHHLVADLAVTQAWQQTRRQHKVIKPPTHILPTGVHHVGPEAVGVCLLRVELSEAVNKTGRQQLTEALPLFGSETCVFLVALWVLQVDFLVCDVEVTTQNQRLLHVQLGQVCSEVRIPGFAVIKTHETSARVWHVDCYQVEVGELCSNDAALLVMFFIA